MQLFVDAVGWMGAIGVLLAYGLVSTRRVDPAAVSYQLLNFSGATGLGINTLYYAAYPSTALNGVWALIAVAGLWRIFGERRAATT